MSIFNVAEKAHESAARKIRRSLSRLVMLVCAAGLIGGLWGGQARTPVQTQSAENQHSADQQAEARRENNDGGCRGPVVRLSATKLLIEHNATDEDTGVQGFFEGPDWTSLSVYDPRGRLLLEVEPQRQLRRQSLNNIFFESAEPPNDEVPIEEILARFPAGQYAVRGCAKDGRRLSGAATFTHNIPAAPVIVFPQEDSVVSAAGFTVMWNHVTTTLNGRPLNRTGYEVIITKEALNDPHGFSKPTLSVHVPPAVTSLTIPREFLEPRAEYELEILALEVSGNQTIASLSFKTQ